MILLLFLSVMCKSAELPFSVSREIDVANFKKLIKEEDVIVLLKKCKDLEGRENYLSISSIRIEEKKDKVMEFFKDIQKLKEAIPDVREARIIKSYSDKEYEVEYEIALKIIGGLKISVRYISHLKFGENHIYSYVKEGKNKGSWRVTEFFEDNGTTVVTLSVCENIRVFPIAKAIFSASPHYEIGVITSNGIIILTQMKKYIESKSSKQDLIE